MSSPFIPPKTIEKIKRLGLSEGTVLDVFRNGEAKTIGSGQAMIKKFAGYEIGLFYARNPRTGEYVITAVWKRERR